MSRHWRRLPLSKYSIKIQGPGSVLTNYTRLQAAVWRRGIHSVKFQYHLHERLRRPEWVLLDQQPFCAVLCSTRSVVWPVRSLVNTSTLLKFPNLRSLHVLGTDALTSLTSFGMRRSSRSVTDQKTDLETYVSTSLLPGQIFIQQMVKGFPHVDIGIVYYLPQKDGSMVRYSKGLCTLKLILICIWETDIRGVLAFKFAFVKKGKFRGKPNFTARKVADITFEDGNFTMHLPDPCIQGKRWALSRVVKCMKVGCFISLTVYKGIIRII